jgi:ketosteroid isomerase-like protein
MKIRSTAVLFLLFLFFCGTIAAQTARRENCGANSALNGVYQIDNDRSDELYSVIENASSNVPYSEQQIFFIDLAVRLTPPDMLAIECRGNRVSLGSSRAPRVEFTADGVTRAAQNSEGRGVRSRIAFERDNLTFDSRGGRDNLSFTFTPIDGGRSLRVTRRISARELNVPVIIQTVYNKIGDTARWDIFDGSQIARQSRERETVPPIATTTAARTRPRRTGTTDADALRASLDRWIDSTNQRDINGQMAFYMPQLQAFYLVRNASLNAVRAEKTRVFARAKSIDIRAAEPEIIFQDGGRTAVMRFRKKYSVVNGTRNQRGEVVQELRWRRTPGGWKIFSERDIRVIN